MPIKSWRWGRVLDVYVYLSSWQLLECNILMWDRHRTHLVNSYLTSLMCVRFRVPKSHMMCRIRGNNCAGPGNWKVLAHSYADCSSDYTGTSVNHKPWRWGSDYCAGQQLWGSLADPMDTAQHQNNTTQNVTQTFHWRTNKTSLELSLSWLKSWLVWHTINKLTHTGSPHEPPRLKAGNCKIENLLQLLLRQI